MPGGFGETALPITAEVSEKPPYPGLISDARFQKTEIFKIGLR
jgi:hypothetical protein